MNSARAASRHSSPAAVRVGPLLNPASLLIILPTWPPLQFSCTSMLSLYITVADMSDTTSTQIHAQPSAGVEAPPADAEVQEYVFPPWANGSDPTVPTVDHNDNHVRLDSHEFLRHHKFVY